MMSQLHITSSLLQELAAGLRGEVFTPQFGEVYHGKLPNFGHGIPHNAMVRGGLEGRPGGPLVPFAPITSKKHKERGVMVVPKGILPPKAGVGPVVSYVLLFWYPVRVPEREVRDVFRKQATLPERYIAEARRLIAVLTT